MPHSVRTLLLVLALGVAQAATATAQVPPAGPTTAPATQGARPTAPPAGIRSATTQPAATQPPIISSATEPATTQPATTQPATTQPATSQSRPTSRPVVTQGRLVKEPPPPVAVRLPTTAEPPAVVRTEPASSAGEKAAPTAETAAAHAESTLDFWSMVFVFMLATFIGLGIIRRVSRLLHTPLMSLTNAISAIAVVGSIMLAGGKHYPNNWYHFWGALALFASMTNIVSGFLITDRMLKMFKTREGAK